LKNFLINYFESKTYRIVVQYAISVHFAAMVKVKSDQIALFGLFYCILLVVIKSLMLIWWNL